MSRDAAGLNITGRMLSWLSSLTRAGGGAAQAGDFLQYQNGTGPLWAAPGGGGGDHGALTGLGDDDHTQYQLRSEENVANGYAGLDGTGRVAYAQLPTDIATDGDVNGAIVGHETAGDPHTQYQLRSEKGAIGGYAGLNGTALVPPDQLGGGTPTTSTFLRGDNAWVVPPGGGGPSTTKKTSDETKNNTTLADMVGMSFPLVANNYYHFQFFVLFRSAGTTTGIRLSLSTPAFTRFGATARIPIAADGAGGEFQGWITASDDPVIGTGVQAANTDYVAVIEGTILPSAGGTLQVRFANETGAVVVTARQGSTGLLHNLGT